MVKLMQLEPTLEPETFFRNFYPQLYQIVSAATGAQSSEVDDLVQETLVHAWRNRERFRGESSWATWMKAIARNKLRDLWRKKERIRKRDAVLQVLSQFHETQIPDRILKTKEACRCVRGSLYRLPKKYSDLLIERYIKDRGVREIAEDAGISEKAIEGRLQRAREAFRAQMQKGDVDVEL